MYEDLSDLSHHSDLVRYVVDRVPSMLAYWDRNLHCRFVNQAYQRWFGVDPRQLVGTSLADLLGPALFAKNEPYVRRVLQGEQQTFERIVPGADGSERRGLVVFLPDVIDDEVVGFVAMMTEVAELKHKEARLQAAVADLGAEVRRRRAAEDSLADSQAMLAVSLASIDAGLIATDAEGLVVQMNDVSETITGWRAAEARGRSLWQVFQREGREESLAARNPVEVVLQQGLTVETAHHVTAVSRHGVRTPVEVKAAPTFGPDGTVRGLVVVIRDRSRHLQAEMDASQLAAIVESSQDAIIAKRLDGTLMTWNAAAEQLFGYASHEAIGRSVRMLIPPDRQDEEMRILASIARGERVKPFDTQRLHRDGHLLDVSLTISPIRDADGRIIGASKIVRDIADRRAAEAARERTTQLEAENQQIQATARLKSQFLASVSHELRTPLNAIIGFAELLQRGLLADPEKAQRFVGHIATSGHHLLQLINDVLDLAKVESGRFDFHPEPVDLVRVLAEVGDIVQPAAYRKRIALATEIDPMLTGIVLDPVRLKQVLYNYVSNAIKFTPNEGRVVVRLLTEGATHFRVEVADTGIGIAADQMHRLFHEFTQLDAGYNKEHGGTGLGLALTKRLVEAQGGYVGATSVAGEGSVFYAVLNRVHGSDAAGREHGAEGAAAKRAPAARLLVVQSDRNVRVRIINGLAGAGFHVSAAASGEQASNLVRQASFDALTLDLSLPDARGLRFLARLRSEIARPPTPVIGLTAPDGAGRMASFAIDDIFGKPLHSDEVIAAMKRLNPSRGPQPSVMVIDDDPLARDLMRATLANLQIESACFADGRDALAAVESLRPEAIILDLMMPQFDGFAVLDALRRLAATRNTPVFIWTSMTLSDDDYAALERSAQAVISKGGGDVIGMLERLRRWRPAAKALGTE